MRVTAHGIIDFDEKHYTKKHKSQNWKRYVVCNLSCDIDKYYRWWMMKRFNLKLNSPLRGAHVTIINDMIGRDLTEEKYQEIKKKYNGKEMTFEYEISPKSNGDHWWLKVYSNDLLFIRSEAGLGKPHWGTHLTIGIVHPKFKDHSDYILRQCINYNL